MTPFTRLETMLQGTGTGLPNSILTAPAEGHQARMWCAWEAVKGAHSDTRSLTTVEVDINDLFDFREKIADLGPNVFAMLVEGGETGERHITTFLKESDSDLESRIYGIEADIIEKYPNHTFDFHVREIPRDGAGNPILPPGETYFMLTWQSPKTNGN